MAKVTIKDISAAAGVSIATVSRVLNHKGNVSKDVEQRVMEAAKKLHYPLMGSASRALQDPRLIAVIVPSLSNPFYNDILDGIQDVATRNKYNLIIAQTKSSQTMVATIPRFLRGNLIDGLISMEYATNMRALLEQASPDLPVVQCCEYDVTLPYPYVAIDDAQAAYNAVSYLTNIKRKKIAFLNFSWRSLYGKKREEGFRRAMEDNDLPIREDWIYHLNSIDFNVAFSAAQKLLSAEDRPDAIFSISDIYAIAVIRAARRLGLRVPEDVAIIGFDNIEISLMSDPPLTTVSQPRYEIGSAACSTLFGMIKKRPPLSRELLLESELIVRSST